MLGAHLWGFRGGTLCLLDIQGKSETPTRNMQSVFNKYNFRMIACVRFPSIVASTISRDASDDGFDARRRDKTLSEVRLDERDHFLEEEAVDFLELRRRILCVVLRASALSGVSSRSSMPLAFEDCGSAAASFQTCRARERPPQLQRHSLKRTLLPLASPCLSSSSLHLLLLSLTLLKADCAFFLCRICGDDRVQHPPKSKRK